MVLNFSVKGNKLVRKDMKGLTAFTRNNAFAGFEFDSEWEGVSPVAAQFYKNENCCYDVFIEEGKCEIPWEVLEGDGTVKVTVMGGDLIITNSVEIRVYESGLVGGLAATKASPGVYSYIVDMAEKMETDYEGIEGIRESLNNLENNLNSLDEQVGKCEEKISNAESNLNSLDEQVGKCEEKISSAESNLNSLDEQVGKCEENISDEKNRAQSAEAELNERVSENESSIEEKINKNGDSLDGVFVMSENSSVTYDELGEMDGYTTIKKNNIRTGTIYADEVYSNGEYVKIGSIRTSGYVRCEEVRVNYVESNGENIIRVMSDVDFDNDVIFGGNVKFENRCVENVTDTNITAEEGRVYVYSKAVPVSSLNITLSGIDEEKENVFKIRFTAGADNMDISINKDVQWTGNSATEEGRAYCLCIYAAGEYTEAELRG